jgi:hypothetical protein
MFIPDPDFLLSRIQQKRREGVKTAPDPESESVQLRPLSFSSAWPLPVSPSQVNGQYTVYVHVPYMYILHWPFCTNFPYLPVSLQSHTFG